jgi:hypothetical protein
VVVVVVTGTTAAAVEDRRIMSIFIHMDNFEFNVLNNHTIFVNVVSCLFPQEIRSL